MAETPFLESNALLALNRGDYDEAERCVEQLTRNERELLAGVCSDLAALCYRVNAMERARADA